MMISFPKTTLNLYWFVATSFLLWFLFLHAPRYLYQRMIVASSWTHVMDVPFFLHLVGAYSLAVSCMINSLLTPRYVGSYCHIWIGRIGMIGGVIGYIFGLYCCWLPFRSVPLPPLSFSIPISIGGFLQVNGQYQGYQSIRRFQSITKQIEGNNAMAVVENTTNDNYVSSYQGSSNDDLSLLSSSSLIQQQQNELTNHITHMIGVFVFGCGIPGMIRFIGMVLPNLAENIMTYIIAIALLHVFVYCYVRRMVTSMIRIVPPSSPKPVPTVVPK
jgi:hypothetical protein